MKVEYESSNGKMFCELAVGETFKFAFDICLKVFSPSTKCNAVNLSNGRLFIIDNSEKVIPIKARIVVDEVAKESKTKDEVKKDKTDTCIKEKVNKTDEDWAQKALEALDYIDILMENFRL